MRLIREAFKFLSTPSTRRATPQARCSGALGGAFLSTPSARRVTDRFY